MGVASAFMGLTKTVHPPADATALLCSTEPTIAELGWLFWPLIILGTTLLLAVACVLNTVISRDNSRFNWWTPADLSRPTKHDIKRACSGAEGKVDNIEARGWSSSEIYYPSVRGTNNNQ